MSRLRHRLVASHVLTAVVAVGASWVVVRSLTPRLYDRAVGMGAVRGAGRLRTQAISAITQALWWGAVVGIAVGVILALVAAARVVRPLTRLRAAAAELAAGRYGTTIERPDVEEIAELADDFSTLGTALAETEQRRTRLLGEVAHEMRTPLTVIDGTVEAMIDGVLPTGDDELSTIQEEVRRLRRLSDDLSSLSRAEEGRLRLEPVEIDLAGVVDAAARRLAPQADDAGVELEIAVVSVRVSADPDRIAQVVTNLVGNALRATPAGGRIDVRCSPSGDRAVVTVADTGEGLAADDLERIFERFYRVPGSRRDHTSTGSGIGLTIARSIVRAHGGSLSASSPGVGDGSTFTMTLPAA